MTDIKVPFQGFVYLPHQEEGVKWMIERESDVVEWCRGGILADDMGLGKTWQTVGLIKNNPVPRTLLVAPPVLIKQWQDSLSASGIPYKKLGPKRWTGDIGAIVFLTTYDRVWRTPEQMGGTWGRIVLDEGQYIRNGPKTRRFAGLATLIGERKWILSGTPVQNSIFDFKNLAEWLGCDTSSLRNAVGLRNLAENIIMRRPISILSDKMPAAPIHHWHQESFLSDEEENLFNSLIGRLADAIENRYSASCLLELYLRVQMFISHPQIYVDSMRRKYKGAYTRDDWSKGSTKLETFRRLITNEQEPTLVFCHFKMEMDFVTDVARDAGYEVFFIRGGLSEDQRNRQIEASKVSGQKTLLICQIISGNCGLNLQHLNRVIFYTQHWNPAVIDQALTRSYRYGQKKDVSVHHIVLGNADSMNIDHRMLRKHEEKRRAAIYLLPSLEFAHHPRWADPEEVST